MKICLVGAELFHADQWTQRYNEANGCFSQFCQMCLKMQRPSAQQVACLLYHHLKYRAKEAAQDEDRNSVYDRQNTNIYSCF